MLQQWEHHNISFHYTENVRQNINIKLIIIHIVNFRRKNKIQSKIGFAKSFKCTSNQLKIMQLYLMPSWRDRLPHVFNKNTENLMQMFWRSLCTQEYKACLYKHSGSVFLIANLFQKNDDLKQCSNYFSSMAL